VFRKGALEKTPVLNRTLGKEGLMIGSNRKEKNLGEGGGGLWDLIEDHRSQKKG